MHLEGVDVEMYKLDELAQKAGASARTVRYYVQRGLLPAPAFRGKDTAYTREHLVRLKAIRKLQERFLPLDAIQAELAGKSLDEIERLAEEGPQVTARVVHPVAPPDSHSHPYRRHTFGTRWEKWELAPGLELAVAEGAADDVRALVEEIQDLIRQKQGGTSK
jgi:Ca-activated chloride channel family protein